MNDAKDRSAPPSDETLHILESIERKILWLSAAIVHHANHRPDEGSGLKIGGHQASSASMVSLMTALWFSELDAADVVSVKPHASPVLHAINYLLGNLDESYLSRLRDFGGLQSYPSRTKDPDPVDFSTGSVGIGATAPIWAALSRRYLGTHVPLPSGGKHISLLGDAELDEGAIWEAIVEPLASQLGEVLWVVDLNRQSLDRVVPNIAAERLSGMFAAAGWQVVTVKYGRHLEGLFQLQGGSELRERIDSMSNSEYQSLLRASGQELRTRLPGDSSSPELKELIEHLDDTALHRTIRDLGGHDMHKLIEAFRSVATDRPAVIIAYTIKGWSLPTEGHPANHSALLSDAQLRQLAEDTGESTTDPWVRFPPASPEALLCREAAARLTRAPSPRVAPPLAPSSFGRAHKGRVSTQQALGRLFLDLHREAPDVAARVVTVSPDVASSTNLGGWINKVGVWSPEDRQDWFSQDKEALVHWTEKTAGQHIALGIAETNLVGLLGELGSTWSRLGEPLLPVGTLYDPFVSRALEPWSFGIYAGGQSILVGTPSGVTLAPEGGAHQSISTPSIGLEQPGCTAWEPAFAQDLEWSFLDALNKVGKVDGRSAYFRLSTRPIDQSLAYVPSDSVALERRRRQVLAGGYRLVDGGPDSPLHLVCQGAIIPEVLAAATELSSLLGKSPSVICLTSADLLFRAMQGRRGLDDTDSSILGELFGDKPTPLVTIIDGHPHTLAFLAGVNGSPISCMGVTGFGQSGNLGDVYRYHGIDTTTILGASLDLLEA